MQPKLSHFNSCICLLVCIFIFTSCGPDHPEQPQQCYRADFIELPGLNPLVIQCPNPGNNCAEAPCPQYETGRALLDSFYNAYDRNDVASFFNSRDWTQVFPQLVKYPETISRIKNGTYGMYVDPNGSVMISKIPNARISSSDDIVFAFKSEQGSCRTAAYRQRADHESTGN